jgi:hypothetical protein
MFVYIAEACQDEARSHAFSEVLDRLKDGIELSQSLSQFDQFPPPYLVKKKLGGRQGRLIAEVRKIRSHPVVVFLAVMIRGARAYEDEFVKDPKGYGRQHFSDLVSDDELDRFVEERTRVGEVPAKPEPSEVEYQFLYGAFSHQQAGGGLSAEQADQIVCETQDWVEQVAQERIANQLVRLSNTVLAALSLPDGLHLVPSEEKPGWGIWAYRDCALARVLLVGIADGTNALAVKARADHIAEEISGKGAEAILRASRRAYPAIVLTDESLWVDLEKEQEANMALSPEESQVLESARRADAPFPLFINGRAGSGKSTILQYLFADLLFTYLGTATMRSIAPPLYLTANGELLRGARTFVDRLLKAEATLTTAAPEGAADDRAEVLDLAFREFEPFMLSLVPEDERTSRFNRAKRVDYSRFRQLWMDRFGKDPKALREYGPDLSWHVIRSYIKGMGSDDLLSPEDYDQLPENQITVSGGTFRLVHERVFSGWYAQLGEDGIWDDQDLARYILDQDRAPRSYPAVFCDEAQDFTRLELEVLLRLSLFSNRTLAGENVSRVPFAFAGDEFQTLNPTGFRWDAIKAAFVEKFIYELDPSRRTEKADLNYRELRYNYRSTERIVRFSNHVQALRSALFGMPELRPQRPWMSHPSAAPVLGFRSDDAPFWSRFREEAASYVVIVPCHEGEEARFVADDAILREYIPIENEVPRNVLSAARAKGCEYPAVLVYGFGAQLEQDIGSSIGAGTSPSQDVRNSLPLQYFVNRLYVAVSRPKRRLVIVDSEIGFNRLWAFARDDFARERLLGSLKRGQELWGSEIEGLSQGLPEDLGREVVVDRRENARAFEVDGRARRDAYLLMQAANAYRDASDTPKARECRALALDFDGRLLEAGNAYMEAGFIDDARRCLWRAGKNGWLRLLELVSDHPELLADLELQWAKAICSKADQHEVAAVMKRFAERLENDVAFAQAIYGERIWQEAIETLLRPLFASGVQTLPKLLAANLVGALHRIRIVGIELPDRFVAEACFAAEQYALAAELWEKVGETRNPRVAVSKAKSLPYPANIEWLAKIGDDVRLVSEYNLHRQMTLSVGQADAIVGALRKDKRLDDALSVAVAAGAVDAVLQLSLSAQREGDVALATQALHHGIALLVRAGRWECVIEFATSNDFVPAPEWKDKLIRAWTRGLADDLRVTVVRALARSDQVSRASKLQVQAISKFLREYLRVKEGRWKDRISYIEAGAAYERAGRITDMIQFYEAVLNDRPRPDDELAVRRRWMVVKQRQLEYERNLESIEKMRAIEREVQTKQQAWRMDYSAAEPKYAELPQLSFGRLTGSQGAVPQVAATTTLTLSTATPVSVEARNDSGVPPSPVTELVPSQSNSLVDKELTLQVGLLRVEIKRSTQRCLIADRQTMDSVNINWKSGKISGSLDIVSEDAVSWFIPEWNLRVRLPSSGSDAVILGFPAPGLELRIGAN